MIWWLFLKKIYTSNRRIMIFKGLFVYLFFNIYIFFNFQKKKHLPSKWFLKKTPPEWICLVNKKKHTRICPETRNVAALYRVRSTWGETVGRRIDWCLEMCPSVCRSLSLDFLVSISSASAMWNCCYVPHTLPLFGSDVTNAKARGSTARQKKWCDKDLLGTGTTRLSVQSSMSAG